MKPLPNLLIVDDTEEYIFLLVTMIKNIKANIIQALSGQEALEKTNGVELALALIDVRMPAMNGYELALKLNGDAGGMNVPIIFITASHVNEIQIFKGYGSGAVDYIFKPLNALVLVSKINVFLDLYNQKKLIANDAALLKKSADELILVNTKLRANENELEMQNEELSNAIVKAEVATEKYTELYDLAPSGFFTLSAHNTILELNHSGARMLGKDRASLIGSTFGLFISNKTRPCFNDFLNKVFKTKGKEICEIEIETRESPGIFTHVEGMVVANGSQCLINVIDISERKMAEQAITVSEEKYKTILNASPDGILLIDLKGVVTEVSEIGLEIFGADSRDDIVGKEFHQFVQAGESQNLSDIFVKTMNEGLAQNFELAAKKKNQSVFASEISTTLIQGHGGTPLSYMIIIRDISHRKKLKTKQIHADRMASLGEMASGIAHEINQPLNTISLAMDNILYETAREEPIAKEYLKKKTDRIFENITRIRNIIDHVRAFSRNQDDYILTGFNVNLAISDAASMISEQFNHLGINLNLDLQDNLPSLTGNTYKFEQVILNLLSNAKDALLEKKSFLSEHYDMLIVIKSYQKDQQVVVEMIDNGIGISDDDIDNIMLPFYTTKDAGKGTGLGLSISYQIIKEMNGTIEIEKNALNETIFRILL